MPKEGNREVYVRRILEISKNYKDSRETVAKIMKEVKDLE